MSLFFFNHLHGSHFTATINTVVLFGSCEQRLPVNPIHRKGVYLILLVTGCSGHLRYALTKMALIGPSTTCPTLSTSGGGIRGKQGNTVGVRDVAAGRSPLSFYMASLSLMRSSVGHPFSHLPHFHSDYLGPQALTEIQRQ